MIGEGLKIFISLLGVIFVFLFAIEKFSHQINYLAGDKIKRIIKYLTPTPIKSVLSGTALTAVMQSSTAVTVMLVSFAHAGLISFESSLGVIFGANIGTTFTTQLIAFKILDIAPYILILGFFLMKIESKYQRFGKSVFYFGLIFSCLFLMSVLVTPLKDSPFVVELLSKTSNIFIAIGVGFIFANIFQSSSFTSGLVVVFASTGLLDFTQAFGIILGTNIGTTTTALIASLVLDRQAKRVAVAHFMFNTLGVLIFLPFVGLFSTFITDIDVSVAQHVALAHLIFNLIITCVFVIAIKPFGNLIKKMVV